MKSDIQALLKLALKIRTPLALTGLVIVIFYAIYKEVLSLNIFDKVGSNFTFLIIENIIDKVFWLAIVAIVLGVISYLFTYLLSYKSKSLSSNVSLIDASLDEHNSAYKQYTENGIKKIRFKEQQGLANSVSSIKKSQMSSSIPSLEVHAPSDLPEAFIKRLKDAQKSSKLGAIIVLAHKNEAGEEIHLLKKQKTLRSLNTPQKRRSSLPLGTEIVKSSIVNKYEGKSYALYAATFDDIEPDDYIVCRGEISNLRDNSRRRGAGVRADEVCIVDFD